MFAFAAGQWVCVDFCLVGHWTLSGTSATNFRGRTTIVLLSYVILAFYSKFVTTFPTDSAGRNLTYRFNPVDVVISCLCIDCYGWYDWFPGFFIVATFNPLNGGRNLGFSVVLRSFQLVVVVAVCRVDFLCFLFFRGPSIFSGVQSLQLDVLVMWESNLSASQFACCDFYNVKSLTLSGFAGVVAPNYFREPLRLVLLVVISVFIGFCLFRAGTCFA